MLTIRELQGKDEMMSHISVLHAIYPSLTVEEYYRELDQMLPHNYGQVAVFDGEICIGISGFWIGTKLWCGKYLELDNIVVLEKYRSKGVGK
ncbi:MAG: N-acetyltransferase, partial [Flavobacteriia bacterium]|nr:N-acetyltransferase [Flavobacteriia bacterium]